MRIAIALGFLLVVPGFAPDAFASNPGEPFDCADFEIFESGITCSVLGSWTPISSSPGSYSTLSSGSNAVMDTMGRFLQIQKVARPGFICGQAGPGQMYWTVISVWENGVSTELIRIMQRCISISNQDIPILPTDRAVLFFDP